MKVTINYSLTYEIEAEIDDKFEALKKGDDYNLLDEFLEEVDKKIDEIPVSEGDGDFTLNSIWSDYEPLYINC